MKVLVAKPCLILCDPMDGSPPGSSVHGILQARIREWVTIPFSSDLPDRGIEPGSPPLQADSLPSEPLGNNITNSVVLGVSHFVSVLVSLRCLQRV